jgi:hypothetical protein
MNVRFMRPLVGSPGWGKSEIMLGEMIAPEALFTFCPKLLMPWTRRNPPGHRPSFCVYTLRVYSASPQYRKTSSRPPLATPWGVCRRSRSSTTPFFPSSSRSPPQLPVSRGRDQKSPPHVGGMSTGCARVGPAMTNRSRPRTVAQAQVA